MKRKLFTFWAIALLLSLASNQALALPGSGTLGSPYLVASAADLNEVRNDLTVYYKQTADITFAAADFQSGGTYYNSGAGWVPIAGNGGTAEFTGQYDGDGFSISNLTINRGGTANVGLFGHIGRGGVIKNVTLANATVTGGRGTGALIGRVTGDHSTRIEHCSATGTVAGDAATGGLVGSNNSYMNNNGAAESFRPVIYGCWTDVDVSLRSGAPTADMIKFGGMAGCNQKGMISNSYSRGSVTVNHTSAKRIGGFAGCVEKRGIIINCYSTGAVSGTGAELVGGFLGFVGTGSNEGRALNCYFDETTSGTASSAGGTGMNTTGMQNSGNYTDWDFTHIWKIGAGNDGYPDLIENPAATLKTWDGSEGTAWGDADNWTPSGVPAAGDSIIIPTGITNWPVVSSNSSIFKITFGEDAELTIGDGWSLKITGEVIYTGDVALMPEFKGGVSGTGSLIFSGNDIQEIPASTFVNLTIDNPNNARLTGNITVYGNLTMVNGLLDLNGYTITLGSSADLTEDEQTNYSSRIFGTSGYIETTRTLNNPNEDVAGLGFTITSSKNLGTTTIKRGHSQLTGANSAKSILRWYDVSPATNTGLDATVKFNYSFSELAFEDEVTGFSLFKKPIGGSVDQWEVVESTAGINSLLAAGVDGFSTWTATSSSSPMPITLLSFDGKPVNDRVELSWVTAAEINNHYFTIERSANGNDYNAIATVEGAGTTSQSKSYSLTDNEPFNGVSYYRLKQTDYNGEFEYSDPISVYLDVARMTDIRVYPNPSNGRFQLVTGATRDVEYRIIDMQGRTVTTGIALPQTVNAIEMPKVPQGIYNLVLISDEVKTKLIKIL